MLAHVRVTWSWDILLDDNMMFSLKLGASKDPLNRLNPKLEKIEFQLGLRAEGDHSPLQKNENCFAVDLSSERLQEPVLLHTIISDNEQQLQIQEVVRHNDEGIKEKPEKQVKHGPETISLVLVVPCRNYRSWSIHNPVDAMSLRRQWWRSYFDDTI
jgi:hypothetical protein